MKFSDLVVEVLNEENVAGGGESVFGPNVSNTATAFSGDHYAPGDARNPYGLYAGVLTRSGMRKRKRKKKSKK